MSNLNVTELNPFQVIEPPLSGSRHGTPILEQHGIQLDPFSRFYIIAQLLDRFLQDYVRTGHPTSCSGHDPDQHHDGISIHVQSLFCIPAQELIQFLKRGAYTNETPAEQNGKPSYPASWLIPGTDLYQFLQRHVHLASELTSTDNGYKIPAEQNDMLVDVPVLLIPVESLSEFLQHHEIPPLPSSPDFRHETPAVQQLEDGSENDSMSRSVTPTRSQDPDDQVDAQLDEAVASTPHVCPVCQRPFRRAQERNRHVESYLPHSILCPFLGCIWTGRRQWDFQEHWRGKHEGAGQAPGEDANEIYDPGEFVALVVNGTPVDEVARSAFAVVPEGLKRLGKLDVEVKVLGRNRDLKKWIRRSVSLHPNSTSTAFDIDL